MALTLTDGGCLIEPARPRASGTPAPDRWSSSLGGSCTRRACRPCSPRLRPLRAEHAGLRLAIAGTGPIEEELRERARKLRDRPIHRVARLRRGRGACAAARSRRRRDRAIPVRAVRDRRAGSRRRAHRSRRGSNRRSRRPRRPIGSPRRPSLPATPPRLVRAINAVLQRSGPARAQRSSGPAGCSGATTPGAPSLSTRPTSTVGQPAGAASDSQGAHRE